MKALKSIFAVAAVAGLLLFSGPRNSSATSVILLTEKQLVESSDLIVRGIVRSQRSIWGPNKIGIVTLAEIEVLEEVLGRSVPKKIYVRYFGGQIGEAKVFIPGGPKLTVGREVLLFLRSSKYLPENEYIIVGLTQGKWEIYRPPQVSKANKTVQPVRDFDPVVVRSLEGLTLFRMGKKLQKVDVPPVKRIKLRDFISRIRKHWAEIQKEKKIPTIKHLPKPNKIELPKAKKIELKKIKKAPTLDKKALPIKEKKKEGDK